MAIVFSPRDFSRTARVVRQVEGEIARRPHKEPIRRPWYGKLRAVELKDTLVPGESAAGWYVDWNVDNEDYDEPDYGADTDGTFYNPGQFRCLGYDDTAEGERGAFVLVNAENVVVSPLNQIARMIGGSASVDGSKNLTGMGSLYSMDGGQLPAATSLTSSSDPPLYVTGWKTDSGSDVTALWDEQNERYKPIDAPCCSACGCDCT